MGICFVAHFVGRKSKHKGITIQQRALAENG